MKRLAPISIEATDPWIVFDEARLKAALRIDDLDGCPRGTAEFIVSLIDPLQSALGNIPQAVRMCAFGVTKTSTQCKWHHESVPIGGYRIFGSGARIKAALDSIDIEVRTWLRPSRGKINEEGVLRRCLMLEEVVSGMVRKHQVAGVGGLFQITYILNDRVRAVSYEKWISCGVGYGTYARMAVEAGRFVQSHPPSGLRLPLVSPFAERQELQREKGRDFLAELRRLKSGDPGILRETSKKSSYRALLVHGPAAGESTYRPLIIPNRREGSDAGHSG